MLRYLFVEEYSIPVPSDRKSTCLCTCSFSDSYPDNMISEHDFWYWNYHAEVSHGTNGDL